MKRQAVTLTDAAVKRVRTLMERADKPVVGLRIGVRTKGCSGFAYHAEYAEDIKPMEEVVEQDGARVLIEPMATMFILGSEVDFVEDKLSSTFVFNNPNETARCGCGESFSVDQTKTQSEQPATV